MERGSGHLKTYRHRTARTGYGRVWKGRSCWFGTRSIWYFWGLHQHTEGGRVELHFVTPQTELTTGKP